MRRLRRVAVWLGLPLGLGILLVVVGASTPLPSAPAAPVGEALSYADGVERQDLRFPCGRATCAGWLFRLSAPAPPVVVMAHGFAGTRDVALEPFARAFARRGVAAFVFDYRGFGASGGGPRQLATLDAPLLLIASREDRFASFEAAEAFAASHPRARLAEIGGDHFEIYSPPHRDQAARLAAEFLASELAAVEGGEAGR